MQRQKTGIHETAARLRIAVRYVLLLTALLNGSAAAQTNGSASVVSDYRFRGVSLSDGHPEPQIHLGYDNKRGWYAGVFASGTKLEGDGKANAQLTGYAGYVQRAPSGLDWEVGATNSIFLGAPAFNYAEVFTGLASDNVSGRLYFSADYFGLHASTLYAELNGSYPLRHRLHLLGHVGFLQVLSRPGGFAKRASNRFDLRVGASAVLDDWSIQLAWVAATKDRENSPFYGDTKPAWTLAASYSF